MTEGDRIMMVAGALGLALGFGLGVLVGYRENFEADQAARRAGVLCYAPWSGEEVYHARCPELVRFWRGK